MTLGWLPMPISLEADIWKRGPRSNEEIFEKLFWIIEIEIAQVSCSDRLGSEIDNMLLSALILRRENVLFEIFMLPNTDEVSGQAIEISELSCIVNPSTSR